MNYLQQRLTFWDKLSSAEQQELSANTMLHKYNAGQNVHSALNQCVGVLLVKSGELRTYIMSNDGREITLYRISEGNVCILSASCVLQVEYNINIEHRR